MNYISDQKGIMRRYLREQHAWNQHLLNAGSFITDVLHQENVNHVVLLGSGWLLDFPLEKILTLVKKITLVDVYFPPQILRKVMDVKGVECISADITGGYIETVYERLRSNKTDFSIPEDIARPKIAPEDDKLIISLNIMNQLDILLVDYIQSKIKMDDNKILEFRKTLQQDHCSMLQEHPFILISDYRELLINTKGNVLEEKELIHVAFPVCDLSEEWEWQFDTHRLYNAHADTRMKVRALFSKGPHKK